MNRNVPFAIIFLIAMVCVAIVLMLWAMKETRSGRREFQASDTPRSAYTQPNASPVPAVPAPNNDTRADSARGSNSPQNKSR
ncbi:hypothetical protein ACVIWU_005854 [Bradyrhizobium sp. USDA 4509]|uniref:hypothetical protein n=1 Tax=Bradyrhizobium australafricanum TaxID=2821406 RepID=UPI001CE306DA|nr:hypothetical protein [Bradyrhizobium australafricanum]MCA6100074.1 hypothetical protein [Bradyrhizobium australafricanum]MCP1908903.1 hypothetical protein [Bradyrhizobium elkanii]